MLDHARRPPAATGPTAPISQHERKRQHEYDHARLRSHTRRHTIRMPAGNIFILSGVLLAKLKCLKFDLSCIVANT